MITLERHRDEPFDRDSLRLCEAAAELLGPFFDLLYRDDRWISGRAIRTAGEAVQAIRDPRRPTFKLAAAAAVVLLAVLFFAKGEHRVSAKSVTEGLIQRAAVVPFDGFVRTAPARAGDTVRANDLLATMDDRDLRLERLRWVSEVEKATQKYREALAKHDRAEMMLAAAQVDQAQAQLALAKDRLERVQIRAPFDGVVVSGDLSQALGSPMEKGKVLFEIAPLDQYRLILQVDERDIAYVQQGETGTLTLTGLPAQPVALHVTKVTPVASSEDGRNSFRVEATLDGPRAQLRPGMEGVAKLDAGRRNLIWIWTHPLIDWIRLMSWKWLP